MPRLLAWLVLLAACRPDAAPSPYTAQIESPVRGLSAQEVNDLLAGRGAGYARSAELNGYPGPRHVLDLAARLDLTAEQRAGAERIFAAMQAEASRLGAVIVERERALSRAFAEHAVSHHAVETQVDSLAGLYGRLRATHLQAHLEMTALLRPEQIRAYDRLRGYADSAAAHGAEHHPGGGA